MRRVATEGEPLLIRMRREQSDMGLLVVRCLISVLLASLVIVNGISWLDEKHSFANYKHNNEGHMPLPMLSGSEMSDYSYLDALDRMRGGAPKKSMNFVYKAPRKSNVGLGTPSAPARQPAAKASPGPIAKSTRPSSRGTTRAVGNKAMPTQPIPKRAPMPAPAPSAPITSPVRKAAPTMGRPPAAQTFNYDSITPSATGSFGGAPMVSSALMGPEEAPMMSDEEYLPTDSIYVSESAGINAEVQALLDALKRDRASYDIDFGSALRNLGWTPEGDLGAGQGQWRQQDLTGAYGSAYNNLQNDYAGRGMLNSSFYGRGLEDLISSFDTQRSDMISTRQRQFDDWTGQETAAEAQRRQGLDRARAAALARRAAGLQLEGF